MIKEDYKKWRSQALIQSSLQECFFKPPEGKEDASGSPLISSLPENSMIIRPSSSGCVTKASCFSVGFPEQERLKRRDGRHRLFCRHGASCFGKEKEDGKGEARFWGKGPLRFSSRSQACRCGAFSGCAYRIFLKGPVRLCRQLCIIY